MKPSVLFVDDDPMILNGMRRSLRGLRKQWDMSFANSGREALDLFASKPFDVIVSDMQMPEMTGNMLLNEVAARHPECARLILSGYAEEKAVLDTVVQAHQFLAKPCDFEVIKTSLSKIHRVLEQQIDEVLKSSIVGVNHALSNRDAIEALDKEFKSENPSLTRLTEIISSDLAMTVQMIRLSASRFFSLSSNSLDIEKTTNRLGVDLLRKLHEDAGIFRSEDAHEDDVLAVNKDVRACLAKIDSAITSGSVTEAGGQLAKICTALFFSTRLISMQQETRAEVSFERHCGLAAMLAGVWGLSGDIIAVLTRQGSENEDVVSARSLLESIISEVSGYDLFQGGAE